MRKKQYEKPLMKVYEMPQRQQLLVGSSNGGGNVPGSDPYTPDSDPFTF